ncbi:unnamed protein product [Toxocara canis]|uniref:Neprosin domain-containing protein n=1 Tax=Toxocara canis TaxID=6265 RepID=A0A183UMK1_TOXCA|nr:unnamed protein product [Toxocara canis]
MERATPLEGWSIEYQHMQAPRAYTSIGPQYLQKVDVTLDEQCDRVGAFPSNKSGHDWPGAETLSGTNFVSEFFVGSRFYCNDICGGAICLAGG